MSPRVNNGLSLDVENEQANAGRNNEGKKNISPAQLNRSRIAHNTG